MEAGESDWEDLPDWLRDFLGKNELTELVWDYLKKRVPYDTFKDWTFEELRAIRFRSDVLNRSKVSQTPSPDPDVLPFLYSPDEEEEVASLESARANVPKRAKVPQASPIEPLALLHSPDEEKQAAQGQKKDEKKYGLQKDETPDYVPICDDSERRSLILEIIRIHTRLVDASDLVQNYPDLVRMREYFGPPLKSLNRMQTRQLRKLCGKLP